MKPLVTMRAALSDPDLFGSILAGESWASWRVLLIAIVGEELTAEERIVFKALTGREREPLEQPVEEFWGVFGRRAGKTRAMAVLAAYLAALCEWADLLAPGERASLPLLSASVQQSAKMLQYLTGIFTAVPALKALVIGQTVDSISLNTGVDIECSAANFRTIRGGTAIGVIADEVAFWRNENSWNPDAEILNAARPMLATTNGPLICNTSPYARKGEVWNAWRRDYGPAGDPLILVAQADSRTMNPGLSENLIARAYERDPASASAEYGAQFRTDIESFVSPEAVDAATPPGRIELPYTAAHRYTAFVDAAGGSGGDSMTLAFAHNEKDVAVLDLVREVKPPFSPKSVVDDFVKLLGSYKCHEVTGDRWGGEFVREQFEHAGVRYKISERPKSDIYKELLPLLNSGRVELLDVSRLRAQLLGLERRTARGGRDSIDHPPGAAGAPGSHDDVANAAAGALVLAATKTGPMIISDEVMKWASSKPWPRAVNY